MIVDLEHGSQSGIIHCDVCVAGTGAAGLAIVSELARSDLSVVVLEAGGESDEDRTQKLYRSEFDGAPFESAHSGRFRVLGGSTTRWGGQALPLRPLDFVERPWVNESGWPLGFSDLAPYYKRANAFLGLDEHDYDHELRRSLGAADFGFDSEAIEYHFSKWSPTPDLRRRYWSLLSESTKVRVILHANATNISLFPERSRVEAVIARSLSGQTLEVKAQYFVLCCGGIENARLLLANSHQHENGIGNRHDLVGRYLQDHPASKLATLAAGESEKIQRWFNQVHKGRWHYSVRCSATDELQRRRELLSISATFMFQSPENSAFSLLRSLRGRVQQRKLDRTTAKLLFACTARSVELLKPGYRYFVGRRSYVPNSSASIVLNCEQEPCADSRVSLSRQVDALGIPRARITWKVSELTLRTMAEFGGQLRDRFRQLSLANFDLPDWLASPTTEWRSHISDQNHHIGTTRMHDSPMHGVVDRECRVHGIENLFIGGSSVFPTGGHSNPTLTLIALCIRLSDLLKTRPMWRARNA